MSISSPIESIRTVEDAISFAKIWCDLGDAVSGQVEEVLAGTADADDLNPNAIEMAAVELRNFPEVRDPLVAWLRANGAGLSREDEANIAGVDEANEALANMERIEDGGA